MAKKEVLLAGAALFVAALLGGCGTSSSNTTKPYTLVFPSKAERSSGDTRKAIVFVHGVGGDAKGTWTSSSGVSWFDLARKDRAFEQFDLHSIGYYSPLTGGASDINEIAIRMVMVDLADTVLNQYDEVYFVAHSMGGLILKRSLVRLRAHADRSGQLQNVAAVMFISTPGSGSKLADWASWLSLNPQLKNMATEDGASLLNVFDSDWRVLLQSRPTNKSPPQAFCAYEKLPMLGFTVVPRLYSEAGCDGDRVAFDFNHSDMVKPLNETHHVYRWVRTQVIATSATFSDTRLPPQARARFLSAIGVVRTLEANYFLAHSTPAVAHQVVQRSDAAIAGLTTIANRDLRISDRFHKDAFVSAGYLFRGGAWDMTSTNREEITKSGQEALRYSQEAMNGYKKYKSFAEREENRAVPKYANWLRWDAETHYDQFIYHLIGRSHLLLYKAGNNDGKTRATEAFARVSKAWRYENNVQTDHLIRWFCKENPSEASICG